MRHAFDADHISAIDNTTRKLMAREREHDGRASEKKNPTRIGRWSWAVVGIAAINVVILCIVKVFREMRSGIYDGARLEQHQADE